MLIHACRRGLSSLSTNYIAKLQFTLFVRVGLIRPKQVMISPISQQPRRGEALWARSLPHVGAVVCIYVVDARKKVEDGRTRVYGGGAGGDISGVNGVSNNVAV